MPQGLLLSPIGPRRPALRADRCGRESLTMTRVQHRVLIAGLTVCCIGLGAATLADPSPSLSEEQTGHRQISEYLGNNADPDFRSLSAFVLRDGQAVFGGLGTGADDEFEIASISKMFTTDLLRLQLESGDILSSIAIAEVRGGQFINAPTGDVTALDLAEHTSGLPRLRGVGMRRRLAPFFNRNPYADISEHDVFELAVGPR